MTIAERIHQIRQQLPAGVRLIAVTKQVPPASIREAYEAGVRDFGENRLQEALPKQEQLRDLADICWHFIGHLQSNKAKKAMAQFQWIHSLDSLKLAQHLDRLAADSPKVPQVCLQVKILPDPDKYGWSVPQLLADLPQLEQLQNLKIRGLMAILPLGLSPDQSLAAFQEARDLAQSISARSRLSLDQLSMGMSGDYWLAVRAGATMVRLGTLIFGERNLPGNLSASPGD